MAQTAMRRAITIGLLVVSVALLAVAAARSSPWLAVLAVVPLCLLFASGAGPGRIAAQSRRYQGQPAKLRIWGMEPEGLENAPVVVNQVWALGAGLHLNAVVSDSGRTIHVKVAQPRCWSSDNGAFTINDAKYVQVSGETVRRIPGTLALEVIFEHSAARNDVQR